MPFQYCPCGKRLERSSVGRPLKLPSLRLFLSIRMMEPISTDAKICGSCRGLYYDWKRRNSDFDNVLSRIDEDVSYDDNVESEVNESLLLECSVGSGFV